MLWTIVSVVLWPVLVLLTTILVLSVTGRSLGIREAFADQLTAIFEWGASKADSYRDIEEDEDDPALTGSEVVEPRPKKKRHASGDSIILREKSDSMERKLQELDSPTFEGDKKPTTVKVIVDDTLELITAGVESIIEDQVTSRFKAEQLVSWNLLTRTSFSYEHINWRLTLLWFGGFIFRYCVLVPLRIVLFSLGIGGLWVVTAIASCIPNREMRKSVNKHGMLMCFRVFSRAFSSIIRFHNRENRATQGGICVANHTSPIDIMILSCDNCYAMIGQRQGGFLGFLQNSLSRSEHHIWFERSEAKDRKAVTKRLQEHVDDPNKLPIIIFPEGTCINNTSVMMFKKGSFEIGRTIYPIAMKYDSRLGDAFWNSSEQGYAEYLFRMMTSWALICDVWYLPPMTRMEGESAIDFAKRVKRAICNKGGLVDLEWDGMLKRSKVPAKMVVEQQKKYWERLSRTTSITHTNPNAYMEYASKLSKEPMHEPFDEEGDEHKGENHAEVSEPEETREENRTAEADRDDNRVQKSCEVVTP
ncbi:hypothetical protein QR680_002229 [Steinernema hermaphroditum]|uniref:Phospholipid/glycerol acyltransferase domain-containing protein n=1 Tax=Steinernema hermaphroditum TaxID=289476 RepID=A0AA39H1W6_9BILA|nr:hypothetical protein QR680_002229 [Steinernema hermaphroditum]